LTINDLGTIEEVANSAVSGSPPLDYADRRTLRDYYGDITITGSPSFFFIDNGVVRTYPVGGTLAVRYYKRTPLLVAARGHASRAGRLSPALRGLRGSVGGEGRDAAGRSERGHPAAGADHGGGPVRPADRRVGPGPGHRGLVRLVS
jgi:hypothetical protein